jgi:hypothetical protein
MNEIKAVFLAMLPAKQVRVLSLFAHNLTICARSAYLAQFGDGPARKRLRAFNELLHTVTAHVAHMVKGDLKRYPDEVFMDILIETAQAESCESDLIQAFEWSHSANLNESKTFPTRG